MVLPAGCRPGGSGGRWETRSPRGLAVTLPSAGCCAATATPDPGKDPLGHARSPSRPETPVLREPCLRLPRVDGSALRPVGCPEIGLWQGQRAACPIRCAIDTSEACGPTKRLTGLRANQAFVRIVGRWLALCCSSLLKLSGQVFDVRCMPTTDRLPFRGAQHPQATRALAGLAKARLAPTPWFDNLILYSISRRA